jgi:hypothetical protein
VNPFAGRVIEELPDVSGDGHVVPADKIELTVLGMLRDARLKTQDLVTRVAAAMDASEDQVLRVVRHLQNSSVLGSDGELLLFVKRKSAAAT